MGAIGKVGRLWAAGTGAALLLTSFAATPAMAVCAGTADGTGEVCASEDVDVQPTVGTEPNIVLCGWGVPCMAMDWEGVSTGPSTVSASVVLLGSRTESEIPIEVDQGVRLCVMGGINLC